MMLIQMTCESVWWVCDVDMGLVGSISVGAVTGRSRLAMGQCGLVWDSVDSTLENSHFLLVMLLQCPLVMMPLGQKISPTALPTYALGNTGWMMLSPSSLRRGRGIEKEVGYDRPQQDPPSMELEAKKILAEVTAAAVRSGKEKRRWDVTDGATEATGVKMEEAKPTTPKKHCSQWTAVPTNASQVPECPQWNQAPHQAPMMCPQFLLSQIDQVLCWMVSVVIASLTGNSPSSQPPAT